MRHRNRRALRALVALHLVAVPLALFTSSEAIASTNTNACLSNATATYSDLDISMTGSAAPDPVQHGVETATLSDTKISVQVPADLLLAGYRLNLLSAGDNTLNATLDATIEGSNSVEGTATVSEIASVIATIVDPTPANKSSGDESAQPISVSNLALPDTTWTPAAGGSMTFSEKSAHISVPVAGGIITVAFECKPGTSSGDGASWTPAAPAAFATITVEGGPSTTAPASTTTTAAPATTTATAATTTTVSTTTTTTVPGSTTTTGSAEYTTSCTNNVTSDLSEIPITVKGTVPTVVEAGKKFALTKHEWKVTVPASVLDTGIGLGLIHAGDVIDGEIDAAIFGTNTAEGLQEKKGLPVKVGPIALGSNGKALPAVATVKPGDMTFTAVKDPAALELAGAKVSVDLGLPSPVTFSCSTAGDVSPFVSLKVEGKTNISAATTTTTVAGGTTTTVAAQAATTTTTVSAAGGSSLPRTGPPSTLLSVVAALVLIDLGYLLWSATRPARRRVIVS